LFESQVRAVAAPGEAVEGVEGAVAVPTNLASMPGVLDEVLVAAAREPARGHGWLPPARIDARDAATGISGHVESQAARVEEHVTRVGSQVTASRARSVASNRRSVASRAKSVASPSR
jgi:hypothetical protein